MNTTPPHMNTPNPFYRRLIRGFVFLFVFFFIYFGLWGGSNRIHGQGVQVVGHGTPHYVAKWMSYVIVCGNHIIESPEQCDDGNRDNGDGCSSICTWEYVCGNGIKEKPEQCDEGPPAGAGPNCAAGCKKKVAPLPPPVCGDGVRQGIEFSPGHCEDGNLVNGDGCSSTCMTESVPIHSPPPTFKEIPPK